MLLKSAFEEDNDKGSFRIVRAKRFPTKLPRSKWTRILCLAWRSSNHI
jgi:hypothetical protein